MLRRTFLVSLGCTLAAPASAQPDFPEFTIVTHDLGDGLYAFETPGVFTGGNIGMSVGPDGAFIIDDKYDVLSERMLAAIRAVTDAPIRFVINTHHHGDHMGGNAAFSSRGAYVLAQDNVRTRLVEALGHDHDVTGAHLPAVTFSHTLTLHLNGHTTLVEHIANAHTDNDAFVYFKEANVLHTGDLLTIGGYPNIDVGAGGHVDGFLAAQEYLIAAINDDTTIIPGHGPICRRADLQRAHDILKTARDIVAQHISAGQSEAEILAENPLQDMSPRWGPDPEGDRFIIGRIYASLTRPH